MIRTALVVAMLAFGATALVAQSDPIAARKALMKANGDQSKVATDMLEAKQPFNLDAAKKVFATFAEAGEKAPVLFPTIPRPVAIPRHCPRFGRTRPISPPGSPSLPARPRRPGPRPRTSTASRSKSPRCARIAAGVTRPTVRRPRNRLGSSQSGAAVGATGRPSVLVVRRSATCRTLLDRTG